MTDDKTGSPVNGVNAASLAKAVSLHMEGNLPEALEEINAAIEGGDESLNVFAAKAQIQLELEHYEDAAKSYAKVLSMNPRHSGGNLKMAACLERLGRWEEALEVFWK